MIEDMRSLILRDRNHPSVILWSLCNEVLCDNFNAHHLQTLKQIMNELDPLGQRPLSAAMNFLKNADFEQGLDVIGINYQIDAYDRQHKQYPTHPFIASETSSDYSDRSVYANDDKVN